MDKELITMESLARLALEGEKAGADAVYLTPVADEPVRVLVAECANKETGEPARLFGTAVPDLLGGMFFSVMGGPIQIRLDVADIKKFYSESGLDIEEAAKSTREDSKTPADCSECYGVCGKCPDDIKHKDEAEFPLNGRTV